MLEMRPDIALSQRTQLILTPRMRQALALLQAPVLELRALVNAAHEENPFLEVEDPWDGPELMGEAAMVASAPGGWEDGSRREPVAVAREDWPARLLRQFRLRQRGAGGGPASEALAEYILGCLDERGYLAFPPAEIASATGVSPAEVERVRAVLLRLEPPGLAARDLRECLGVQLEQRGLGETLAARIVAEDLDALARQRLTALAAKWRVSPAAVVRAGERIRSLWPHPAALIDESAATPVFPDLVVTPVDGGYLVSVAERYLPRVWIAGPAAALQRRLDAGGRAFVADRLARARWLVTSLDARRRTLVRLMQEIVAAQRAFFERGVHALQPLSYRQVAERLDLHESTVARAVRGKYVQTSRGVRALRFFFARGLATGGGGRRAPASVAARIRELIAAEDRARPLTDEEITRVLRREHVRIARRTVAKYRDRMRIPTAGYRRRTR